MGSQETDGKHCAVYVFRAANGLHKIGVTNDVKTRIIAIRAQSPVQIKILGILYHENADEIEKSLHCDFAEYRHHGEWFSIPDSEIGEMMYDKGFTLAFGKYARY